MATVSSFTKFPGDDDDDSQNETNSTTTVTKVVYSPQWNYKSNMKIIPKKQHKKNNKSIVDIMQSNKQSSWCSSKPKTSNEEPQSFHRSSSTRTPLNSPPIGESTHQTIFQSNQKPLSSYYSSSQFTSSDDFLNNNPFVNRLRNPSVAQKYGHSYFDTNGSSTDSRNANFDTFFPESSTTADSFFDNLESRVERKPSIKMQSKYISEHRFHWSENIEYCSPWVRQRAKEIADHVNGLGLFDVKKKSEVSENDSKQIHKDLKSEVVNEDSEEINDDITYKIASKLCDTFLKHDETNTSDNNQCPNDENFKWSRLYQKLIHYKQL
ncbi:uncharacterized protein LOC100569697 [Acyrthosiphon pisum]|uniref:Uncharacterized protein n=1 Tax=Acyrthosiphon pisum TaxID=7029 RepID=A0A8R2AEQ2_ACYPI|nr:uncharacterized protein LOC100569697 [Acyrthosiphon pisum]|eukprot:XP_003246208.1 PREDICTED: uncharacterized protein LOC100569697 [Acyrthosiphon pisum]